MNKFESRSAQENGEAAVAAVQAEAERVVTLENKLDAASATPKQHRRSRARKITTLVAGALVALQFGGAAEAGDKKGGGIGGWLKKNADTILVGGASALDAARYGGSPIDAGRRGVGAAIEEKNRRTQWEEERQLQVAQEQTYQLEQQVAEARQRQEQVSQRLQEIDTQYRSARHQALMATSHIKGSPGRGVSLWKGMNEYMAAQITLWKYSYNPEAVTPESVETATVGANEFEEMILIAGRVGDDKAAQEVGRIFADELVPMMIEREGLLIESKILAAAVTSGSEDLEEGMARLQRHAEAVERASQAADRGARLRW